MQCLVGTPVLLSCLGGLATGFSVFSLECRLLSCVLHPFGPFHDLRSVSRLDDGLRRDQVNVVHLVAVRAQYDEILRVVVPPVPVNVGDFKHRRNAEAAMSTQGRIGIEGNLPKIDLLSHFVFQSQR